MQVSKTTSYCCAMQRTQTIVHVSGVSGIGKTTLANRLRNELSMRDFAVLDTDDFLNDATEDGVKLSKLNTDEDYTREYMKLLRKNMLEFVERNKRAKVIVLVGFFDGFTINDEEFVKYVCAFAHERYYIQADFVTLVERFYNRVRDLTKKYNWLSDELKRRGDSVITFDELINFEVQFSAVHSNYGFVKLPVEQIFSRINKLAQKSDTKKSILFVCRNKRTLALERVALSILHTDGIPNEVLVDKEPTAYSSKTLSKKKIYFPIAQAEKIWELCYRLNIDGIFNFKTPPKTDAEMVKYDEHYGTGKDVQELFDLFHACIE